MAEVPEIMSCFDFNQLQPNESLDQCGFAATALCFAAGPPGSDPRHPVQWAIQMMAAWYTEFDGPNILSNKSGMEDWQLYKLIVEKGGHYQSIDPHAESIASWIRAKYPVIVAVTEDSVYDVHLPGKPYTWNTAGLDHIFTVTGIDHGHVFLCRDTVNQHSGSPYSYDGDKLVYLSATVFVPDWLPRPTSAIAPHATAVATPGAPAGWHYDPVKKELTAPNGVKVALGFCDEVMKGNWPAGCHPVVAQYYRDPLEDSNPALGPGDQQPFNDRVLGYPHNPQQPYEGLKNKVIVEYAGKELVAARQIADARWQQVQKYYNLSKQLHDTAVALQADNAKLQADVLALQQALPK